MKQPTIITLALIASLMAPIFAQSKTLVINKIRDTDSPYMLNLLKLALSYSDTQYVFQETPTHLTKAAAYESLRQNEINVIWVGTSEELEQEFQPVRIDGYRGLLSMRFMIIRKGDQSRFNNIHTLEDLKSIRFGQGYSWVDGKILEYNGLTVRRSVKKNGLYYMLDGGRFEAFPRGATEAWEEVKRMEKLPLQVEENIIIFYPLPAYFFVNKENTQLAKDVENGLESALADGAFDKFFYSNEAVIDVIESAKFEQRRVITVKNPYLPKATPLEREELWLTIDELIEGSRKYM